MPKVLIVFAKGPVPGQVKTRLTEVLTPREAADLYAAFLKDALLQYQTLGVDIRLYLGSPVAALPDGLVPEGVVLFEQQGEGLGERMKRAFVETFAAGYECPVILGTDHPTLPTAFIEQAFEALETWQSLCLGPSQDGGYYLLGMNDLYLNLFDDMEYSHEKVFDETMQRALKTPATITVLPSWYDVDTPDSLRQLLAELTQESCLCENTRRMMGRLVERYPTLKKLS